MDRGHSFRFKNPTKAKPGFLKFRFYKIVNLFLLLGLFLGGYFFIFSSFYNITNIEVQGNKIISTDDVLDIVHEQLGSHRLLVFNSRNIFVFDKQKLKKKISAKVVTDSLRIDKILPNTLKISITEKLAVLKWVANDEEYLTDSNGIVIKKFYKKTLPKLFQLDINPNLNTASQEIPAESGSFIKVSNQANQNVNLNDKVLSPEDVQFVLNLWEEFNNFDYLRIISLSVPSSLPPYLEVKLESGCKIYFNLVDSLEKQISRLHLLIDKDIKKENLYTIDYIDLRLGQKTYILRK